MILGITTATPRCTVALVGDDGEVLGEEAYEDEMNHAERIFPTLDRLLSSTGRAKGDIERVACDVGPGSFTGIRVGLASAKGIALALGVPLTGVGSLRAMCAAALSVATADIAVAHLDAKRGETFVGAYDRALEIRFTPRHLPIGTVADDLMGELRGPSRRAVVHCGRAAAREGVSPIIDDPACELPSASWVARVAARSPAPPLEAIDDLEPDYGRAPDAKPMV
jgi:tRNA threonylcarbamoyladenosine biosynthesis protein TsaB